ncbi:hypothetical protein QUA35_23595 [Microcoleus sp. N9_B2]|uniref:hypothetical protein n=1 Tax=unclassified Microcoleus TaxID=2642155 RepID=UPI002FD2B9F2
MASARGSDRDRTYQHNYETAENPIAPNITRLIISIAFSPNSSTVKRKKPSLLARFPPRSIARSQILTIIQGDR